MLALPIGVWQLRVAILARRDAQRELTDERAPRVTSGDTPPQEGLATAGPREAALEAARVLTAIDHAARGRGELQEAVESLLERTGRSGRHSDFDMAGFRRRISVRGLDPRICITHLVGHEDALRRWLEPVDNHSQPRDDDSPSKVLTSFIRALAKETSEGSIIPLSPGCRYFLSRSLKDGEGNSLAIFLEFLALYIPPVESMYVALPPVPPVSSSILTRQKADDHSSYRQHQLAAAAKEMCQLPPADPYVVGRGELVVQIAGAIRKRMARRRVSRAFLSGQPGAGTSTVAIEVARILAQDFPGGVIYLDLRGLEPELRRSARTVVRIASEALGFDIGSKAMSDDQLFTAFSAQLLDKRILLVLDNALDSAHVSPLVRVPRTCCVIVTSRDRIQSFADRGLTKEIKTLDRKSSVEVLAKFTSAHANNDLTLDNIARLCSDVPLALRIIGARMASRPDLNPGYFAQLLGVEFTRLNNLEAGDRSVKAAIKLSYDYLDEDTRYVLHMMAATPGSVVTAGELGHCLDKPSASQELLLNRLADRSLVRQALLRMPDESFLATFMLFELVRLFAAEMLGQNVSDTLIREFQLRAVTYLRDRLAEINGDASRAELSGELDPARFHAAERLAEDAGWLDVAIELAEGLWLLYHIRKEVDSMIELNKVRVGIYIRRGQYNLAARSCMINAEILRSMRATVQALASVQWAREIARERDLPIEAAEADFLISVLQADQENWRAALEVGERAALELTELGREWAVVPVALNNFHLARKMKDTGGVVKWGRVASELADRSRNRALRGDALLARGVAECWSRNYAEAIEFTQQAAATFSARKYWAAAAFALEYREYCAKKIGDIDIRVESLSAAADYRERQRDPTIFIRTLIDLSAVYTTAGSYQLASSTLARALQAMGDRASAVPVPLGFEVRVRAAAIQEFLAPSASQAYISDDLPAAGAQKGELRRALEVLQSLRSGHLSGPKARDRLLPLMTSSSAWNSPDERLALHDELGEEPPLEYELT